MGAAWARSNGRGVVNEHPKDEGHGRLVYGGVAFETGVPRPRMVKIVVIVQYSGKTQDQSKL